MSAMRLSVLGQSPRTDDAGATDTLEDSLDLARLADDLGFHRVWFAEHHRSRSFAGTSPEMLAALALERTSRPGSAPAGFSFPATKPTRSPRPWDCSRSSIPEGSTWASAAEAVRPPTSAGGHRTAGSAPGLGRDPGRPRRAHREPWVLGAGGSSAPLAAALGAGYAFGHFFDPLRGRAVRSDYRAHLPSGTAPAGPVLAVRAVGAADPERAAALALAMLLWRARKDLGDDAPVPSLTDLDRHIWTPDESRQAAVHSPAILHGTPDSLHARLTALAATHGVKEIMINTLTAGPRRPHGVLRTAGRTLRPHPRDPSHRLTRPHAARRDHGPT
ncbi:hypothetical protein GCM10022221_47960 [Actinocorallia aurea]